jgi:uncharacterized protein YdiU (UPF0061 family)
MSDMLKCRNPVPAGGDGRGLLCGSYRLQVGCASAVGRAEMSRNGDGRMSFR